MAEVKQISVEDVRFVQDVYPRVRHDPAKVQDYAEAIDNLPPIEVNQDGILIDGYHRWTAHRKVGRTTIQAIVTHTDTDRELHRLAMERNNAHGLQVSMDDKRRYVVAYYDGSNKDELAREVSVSVRTISNWVADKDKQIRTERQQQILDLWLACWTQDEIAKQFGFSPQPVKNAVSDFLENFPKNPKLFATFADDDFTTPLYNIWTFGKKTNSAGHFGNTEQRIVENLLYMYTEPFDIVVDPFAGGGATIDVCRKRMRRYWVSDRLPIVERENEIRKWDILDGVPPLNKRWSDVSLLYLDPPYWRQAEGQYSNDAQDLGNMDLDAFYETLTHFIIECGKRMHAGAHVALIIQPTQWKADDRQYPVDHVTDMIYALNGSVLRYQQRIICPYATEQYNAQQVEWAKANRAVLTLNRELVVWSVQ